MKNIFGQITIIAIAVLIVLGAFHYKTWLVSKKIEEHNIEIENTILKTVKDNFNLESISVLSLNVETLDTTNKVIRLSKENIEKIEKNIASQLSDYYKNQDSIALNRSVPFIIYPDDLDQHGNTILKPEDLENIKNYIKFLTEKTDEAVKEVKAELGRDIDRLNMWTSIWIGFIGIIGALLPLYFQYTSRKQTDKEFETIKEDLEKKENTLTKKIDDDITDAKFEFNEIKSSAEKALDAAKEADNKAFQVKTEIKKHEESFDLIKTDVVKIKDDVLAQTSELNNIKEVATNAFESSEQAKSKIADAISKSDKALVNSDKAVKLLYFSHALSNLKRMDFQNLPSSGKKLYDYLSKTFNSIKIQFETLYSISVKDDLLQAFIKELRQDVNIIKRLVDSREVLKDLDSLIILLNSLLSSTEDEKDNILNNIISLLNSLVDNFSKFQIQ
jgi:hypothetical protein